MSFSNNAVAANRAKEEGELLNKLVGVLSLAQSIKTLASEKGHLAAFEDVFGITITKLTTEYNNKKKQPTEPFSKDVRIYINLLNKTLPEFNKLLDQEQEQQNSKGTNSSGYESSGNKSATVIKGGNRKINKSKRNKSRRNKIAKKTCKH